MEGLCVSAHRKNTYTRTDIIQTQFIFAIIIENGDKHEQNSEL